LTPQDRRSDLAPEKLRPPVSMIARRLHNCENRPAAHAAKIKILRHVFFPKDTREFLSLDLDGNTGFVPIPG
jgi:hypothetical protein